MRGVPPPPAPFTLAPTFTLHAFHVKQCSQETLFPHRSFAAPHQPTGRYPPGSLQEYCAQVTFNCYVDARDPALSGIARFSNHSRTPNMTKRIRIKERRICLYALRDIAVGEELVWDYGASYWTARDQVPAD
jgi:hypothetical protein